jgi:hypothetical protein
MFSGVPLLSDRLSVPAEKTNQTVAKSKPDRKKTKPASEDRLTVSAARSRAKLLHDIYADMLQVLHWNYFREKTEKDVVPSRSLEDVFYGMKRRTKTEARWIAVNANAMHIDHKPKDDFEKAAARAISLGKQEYERVEQGVYR